MKTTELHASPEIVHARLIDISKSFDGFSALTGVTLTLGKGEIHAVLGENGAGKTTLVRILAGTLQPDSGQIEIHGHAVRFKGRRDGAAKGVGVVQQHYGLVDELTGTENYLLGHPRGRQWLSRTAAAEQLIRASQKFGLDADPDALVRQLTIGERQRLEILIALTVGADILILDEPTAALLSSEVKNLTPMLRRLAEQGASIVYITHKLDEVMEIADQVTVLRRGRVTGRFTRATMQKDLVTEAMIGALPEKIDAGRPDLGEQVVELRAVGVAASSFRRGLDSIDLSVRRCEIVGVAGVAGNGQEALAEVLRELAPPVGGFIGRASDRVAYIPEDRSHDGLAMGLSVADNAILYRHREATFQSGWSLSTPAIFAFTQKLIHDAGIAAANPFIPAGALSGGNQQKLVIARELDNRPDLIVAHNPYRGLDVGATAIVRQRLLEARNAGAGIVLISPDLDELFDISNRIVFLSKGTIVGSIDPRSTAISEVGHLIAGSQA